MDCESDSPAFVGMFALARRARVSLYRETRVSYQDNLQSCKAGLKSKAAKVSGVLVKQNCHLGQVREHLIGSLKESTESFPWTQKALNQAQSEAEFPIHSPFCPAVALKKRGGMGCEGLPLVSGPPGGSPHEQGCFLALGSANEITQAW